MGAIVRFHEDVKNVCDRRSKANFDGCNNQRREEVKGHAVPQSLLCTTRKSPAIEFYDVWFEIKINRDIERNLCSPVATTV